MYTICGSVIIPDEMDKPVKVIFTPPVIPYSPDPDAGCDLRLMHAATAASLPEEGRELVIVALVGPDLHIRIFDASGRKVIDKAEPELVEGETLTAIKNRLRLFPNKPYLSGEERRRITLAAAALAGLPSPGEPFMYNFSCEKLALLSDRQRGIIEDAITDLISLNKGAGSIEINSRLFYQTLHLETSAKPAGRLT